MPTHKRIAELINKFRKDELNEEEERELNIWIRRSENNHSIFDRIVEEKYLREQEEYMASLEVKDEWEKIDNAYTQKHLLPPKQARAIRYRLVAACVLMVIAATIVYWWPLADQKDKAAGTVLVDKGSNAKKVLLKLSDGTEIPLDSNINKLNIRQGRFRLIYENDMLKYRPLELYSLRHEIVYNSLTTRYGVQCQVQLPDGSVACLNTASSIRYPLSFEDSERKVTISGEVYFDVVSSVRKKFIVDVAVSSKKKMMVEVLGTQFNINAYDDEPVIKTTLLKGHVKVYSLADIISIKPGQQALVGATGKPLVKNANVSEVTAWKSKSFSFKEAPVKNLLKAIGRWYGLRVLYKQDISDSVTVDIPRYPEVRSALNIVELAVDIHCEIKGDTIIVSKPPVKVITIAT